MKNSTIIKCFITFFVVASIALLIINQHKDKLFSYHNTVGVNIVYMIQDPESGEYQRSEQEDFKVEKNQAYTYEPREIENYDVNLEKSYLSSESVAEPTEFTVYYDCELCTVTFTSTEGELVSGSETQTVRKGQTISSYPEYEKQGYDHVGFLPDVKKVYEDTQFTAVWQLSVYKVNLYVVEGSSIGSTEYKKSEVFSNLYVKNFDFTMDFALPTPTHTSSEYLFCGWNTKADGSGENYSDVPRGTLNDLHLYAIYNVQTYEISYMLENVKYTSAIAPYGSEIHAPTIPASEQKAGYGLNWYTDQNYSELYKFNKMPSGGVTVYGKWEIDTGTGFFGWSPEHETVDNFAELEKFVDYVRFHNVTTENYKIPVTYTSSKSELESDLKTANSISAFRCGYVVSYGVASYSEGDDTLYAICFCNEENTYEYSLKSTPENDYEVYNYLGYEPSGRGSDFNDFYIERLPESQNVEYTNQLLYVVEHGYKPICKPNSPAESVYNKAKAVLNGIICEDYTDYQKVEAIYNWLVMNVQYDHNALTYEVSQNWYKYDAFYMEGVFNKGKAVCDGIAKSFVLLCNIEGIPCVEVSGNSHAWCKVKVNNEWYVADATHGNVQITDSNKSVMSHGEFLISDAEKQLLGYVTGSYPKISANGSYDYFANKTFDIDGVTYDFIINSVDDFVAILKYALKVEPNLAYVSIDIVNALPNKNLNTAFNQAKIKLMLNYSIKVVGDTSDSCNQIIFE